MALARVLMLRPAIIFADEPTSRLDPVSQQDTVALMHDACAATGCAVLLVTHEAALAAAAADRVVALDAPTPARPALDFEALYRAARDDVYAYVATLLWMGAGLVLLWAAASRHRERRRA